MGNLSKDIFAGSGFAPSNIILSKNGGKDFYSKIFEKYTLNNTPLNIHFWNAHLKNTKEYECKSSYFFMKTPNTTSHIPNAPSHAANTPFEIPMTPSTHSKWINIPTYTPITPFQLKNQTKTPKAPISIYAELLWGNFLLWIYTFFGILFTGPKNVLTYKNEVGGTDITESKKQC